MAEPGRELTKAELVAELQASRARIDRDLGGLKFEADVPGKFRRAVRRNVGSWLTGALVAGLVLSKLPRRTRKVYVGPGALEKKSKPRGGLLLAAAKLFFLLVKPVATALLTKKLTDVADDLSRR